ncbi:senescence-associated carboxylesterase 101-like [Vitis riparia]|uniref:senescence-associated carboxylesterase 101-like n=1 Tax=Vitis riparia TaxID=96939 RepID=UPI00155A1F91|nr:senescence-associated carboxylesterase 101-like [Vitis riparia]
MEDVNKHVLLLIVTSNLIDSALTKILGLQRDQTALPSPVQYRVFYPSPKCTIVAFVSSPDCTQNPLPGQGDLVPSPLFDFLCTEEYKSVSINRAALTLFTSLHDHLSGLKTLLDHEISLIESNYLKKKKTLHISICVASSHYPLIGCDSTLNRKTVELVLLTVIEGRLIITGHSLGGSVASLFTLCLLEVINISKPKCCPICITFGSPLIGDFGLQHSNWNSFFLHSISSEVAGGLRDVDYRKILINLKERAIFKGLQQVGERFADPLSAGIIMDLEIIGFDQTKLLRHNIDINTVIRILGVEARILTHKNKASDAKKLNDIKIHMAQLEWYKKKSKDLNKGYYDCFKNQGSKGDIKIEQYRGHLTIYWKDMVAQVQRKPQKEGASFRTSWLYPGTTYRRMVEPLDIAAFYREGRTDYIKNGRSPHYKLLQQWYEEDVKPPSRDKLDSKKLKVSGILTEDSLFWAHVEEAILSCESLKSANSTLEQRKSSWDNLVKFGEYVMEQIGNYAVSPEIFLGESSFMKWWGVYEDYIDASNNSYGSPLISFMKNRSYRLYG